MSKHYSPEWVWAKGKIQTFNGRGGGGGGGGGGAGGVAAI